MDSEIMFACEAGIKELEAIYDYSAKILSTQSEAMKTTYTNNRADELPHIQNLVVAITAMLNGEEPTAAAQMDEDDTGGDDDDTS